MQIWTPGGSTFIDCTTCIDCKFGHQAAPLALVPNFATMWRHLHWFLIWAGSRSYGEVLTSGNHQILLSCYLYQVAPLALGNQVVPHCLLGLLYGLIRLSKIPVVKTPTFKPFHFFSMILPCYVTDIHRMFDS